MDGRRHRSVRFLPQENKFENETFAGHQGTWKAEEDCSFCWYDGVLLRLQFYRTETVRVIQAFHGWLQPPLSETERLTMKRLAAIFSMTVLALVASAPAHAQATRTWVSGVGDDVNPCSRTAPCKTYAGAISKTAAGGEISALDPGGFGAVTITKAMTIEGDGDLASTTFSGTNAVNVVAGANDVVVLRNLSFNGTGGGLDGVRLISGGMLVVENCSISGFTQNGIEILSSGATALSVRKTSITGGAAGVRITSGMVSASLRDVSIVGATNGVYASSGTVNVSHSVIAQNIGVGALADGGAIVSLESNMLTGNGTAAQALTGSTIRLSNNDLFDNSAGFGCGGGILASAANNRKAGNNSGGTVCAPTATINVQ
jgi:hypothetical protein